MRAPEVSAVFEAELEIGVNLEVDDVEEFDGTIVETNDSVEEAVSARVVGTGSTKDMVVSVAEEAVVEASAPLDVRDIAL